MIVNLNSRVRIKLTDEGRRLLGFDPPLADDGYWRTQLWILFEEFGPYIYLGMPKAVFENNNLEILE